jgi:hypothetical protein
LGDGGLELDHRRVVRELDEGADQDQATDAVGVVEREALGNRTPHRVADDDGRVEGERVHERREVGREVGHAVAGGGAVGVAVPALGEGEGADGGRQGSEHPLERMPGVGDAVQEHHRDAGRVALLGVGEPDAGCQLNVLGQVGGCDSHCSSPRRGWVGRQPSARSPVGRERARAGGGLTD